MSPSLAVTLPDFDLILEHLGRIRAHGGIRELRASFPVLPGSDASPGFDEIEQEHALTEGAIRSMTLGERRYPDLLIDERRRMRVAVGSGFSIDCLNRLIAELFRVRMMLRNFDWSEIRRRFRCNPELY